VRSTWKSYVFAVLLCAAPLSARSAEAPAEEPFVFKEGTLCDTDFLLLTRAGYSLNADGKVYAKDSKEPLPESDFQFVLEEIRSKQRLKALLQINLILTKSNYSDAVSQNDREALRAIGKENWPLLSRHSREQLQAYFTTREVYEMDLRLPKVPDFVQGQLPLPPEPKLGEPVSISSQEPLKSHDKLLLPLGVRESKPAVQEPEELPTFEPEQPLPQPTPSTEAAPETPAVRSAAELTVAPPAVGPDEPAAPEPQPQPPASDQAVPGTVSPIGTPPEPMPAQAASVMPAVPPQAAAPVIPEPEELPTFENEPVKPAPELPFRTEPAPLPPVPTAPATAPLTLEGEKPKSPERAAPPAVRQPAVQEPPPPERAAPPSAPKPVVAYPPFDPAAFTAFLDGAPYGRDVKPLLSFLAENTQDPERRIALGLVMALSPHIVLDSIKAGAHGRYALSRLPGREGRAQVALNDGPVVLEAKRLFQKSQVFKLPDSPAYYAEQSLPFPTLKAISREAPSESEEEEDWGMARVYSDGSMRLRISAEQLAGALLHALFELDAQRRGWDDALRAELRASAAEFHLYRTLEVQKRQRPRLDRELEAQYREWFERPEDYVDFLVGCVAAQGGQTDVAILSEAGLAPDLKPSSEAQWVPTALPKPDPEAFAAWQELEKAARSE